MRTRYSIFFNIPRYGNEIRIVDNHEELYYTVMCNYYKHQQHRRFEIVLDSDQKEWYAN
jgi:hypothetical protein